ncbi:hypothetical protein [Desulfovibrio aminophilus]|uniref:hypothetical protein n=1 Tax=Desulfovibrio aminophilus TaxID=81425 RepID=UPI00042733F9|nr:hypothetical protein [Desulfovibrio aminophilus]
MDAGFGNALLLAFALALAAVTFVCSGLGGLCGWLLFDRFWFGAVTGAGVALLFVLAAAAWVFLRNGVA